MRLLRASPIVCLIALLTVSLAPGAGSSSTSVTVACRTTPPSGTVAPWARSYGIGKLSGNGKIYVALPTWAAKAEGGVLHHKMPWLFSPTFKSTAHVSFKVFNAGGHRVGSLSSGSPIVLGGGSGPVPSSLDVPMRGCYRVVAQAGATTYAAWIKVF